MPLFLAVFILSLGGCENKKKTESTSSEEMIVVEFLEPDNFFNEAMLAFDNGDMELAFEKIFEATTFINSVTVENDTVHADVINFAVVELNELSEGILEGAITSTDEMKEVFVSVDKSIGMYHLLVIEDWVINETNDEESLNRMHRALIRTEYALGHAELEITEMEAEEIAKAKTDVAKAEKASHDLWKQIKKRLKALNARLDENVNPLDGTL